MNHRNPIITIEMLSVLKMFGKGQITLPKKWRDKVDSEYFVAEETPQGLLLKPLKKSVYYEVEEEKFGINFPNGINAGELKKQLKKANAKLS